MALMGESLIDIRESDINNAAAREIAKKVSLHRDARYQELFKKNMLPARVVVKLENGEEISEEVLVAKGESSNPMTDQEHQHKVSELIASSPHATVREYAYRIISAEEPES